MAWKGMGWDLTPTTTSTIMTPTTTPTTLTPTTTRTILTLTTTIRTCVTPVHTLEARHVVSALDLGWGMVRVLVGLGCW